MNEYRFSGNRLVWNNCSDIGFSNLCEWITFILLLILFLSHHCLDCLLNFIVLTSTEMLCCWNNSPISEVITVLTFSLTSSFAPSRRLTVLLTFKNQITRQDKISKNEILIRLIMFVLLVIKHFSGSRKCNTLLSCSTICLEMKKVSRKVYKIYHEWISITILYSVYKSWEKQ